MSYNRVQLFDKIIENGQFDDFISFAQFLFITKHYSLFNSALILLQRPGALYVDTEEQWLKKYQRNIKPDATPIVVIHPFGPVNFLYDFSDTHGDKVPKILRNTYEPPIPVEVSDWLLPGLKQMLSELGIYYGETANGSRLFGQARFLPAPITFSFVNSKIKKQTVTTHYAITVNKHLNDAQKATTILHEIGHILCGHLPEDKDNKFIKVPARAKREALDEPQKELEAEKVCETVSKILGFQYDIDYYKQQYDIPLSDESFPLRLVTDAADKVIETLSKARGFDSQPSLFDLFPKCVIS